MGCSVDVADVVVAIAVGGVDVVDGAVASVDHGKGVICGVATAQV